MGEIKPFVVLTAPNIKIAVPVITAVGSLNRNAIDYVGLAVIINILFGRDHITGEIVIIYCMGFIPITFSITTIFFYVIIVKFIL